MRASAAIFRSSRRRILVNSSPADPIAKLHLPPLPPSRGERLVQGAFRIGVAMRKALSIFWPLAKYMVSGKMKALLRHHLPAGLAFGSTHDTVRTDGEGIWSAQLTALIP